MVITATPLSTRDEVISAFNTHISATYTLTVLREREPDGMRHVNKAAAGQACADALTDENLGQEFAIGDAGLSAHTD